MSKQSIELLRWARQLYTISKSGLTYCKNDYDLERYHQLEEISAEMLASNSGSSKEEVLESFSLQNGYATPKIDVRAAIIQENKILLIQEQADGRWAMPGGWADIGDLPAETIRREVLEESGYEVSVDKVIAVLDANHINPLEFYHAYKLIFQCSLVGGQPKTNHETLGVDFFRLDDLPPLSTIRTTQEMLEESFAHHRDPGRPAAFD
jgi:ADP-ribose pyrophosphatase YjhB (NUDIX family)